MTTEFPAVPDGISHTPDLSGLTPAELMEHHRKALSRIAFHQGADGVADYKARYPEARAVFTPIRAGASLPKPQGYYPAWRRLVGQWLTEEAALARTLGQDVDCLNTEIGSGRFDRGRFLSTDLTATERKHAAEVFEARGIPLPDTVRKKSDVKAAAKAGKAKAQHGAKPFGQVGTVTEDTLTIGNQTFRVQREARGEAFIRVTISGTRRRLYLDELEWMAGLLSGTVGATTGEPPTYYTSIDRELANTETGSPRELANNPMPSSLPERISKVIAAFSPRPLDAPDPNIDPLEF